MATSDNLAGYEEYCFVTLRVSKDFARNKILADLFNQHEFCDKFLESLIFFVDRKKLDLYGFVIISDQIHLIVQSCQDDIIQVIKDLKTRSAKELLHLMGKYLNSLDDKNSRQEKEIRKLFNSYLNTDESVFWHKKIRPVKINIFDEKIEKISSGMLINHLKDKNRNYLHIGADAFTRVMMETIK